MKIREHLLVNAQTLTDSQTVTKDLPPGLKIQELRCRYSATNGATSNTLGKLNGLVSKLEVVDGSDVLHSLSGQEEQALNAYRHWRLPFQQLNSKAGGAVIEEFIINFGRFRGDRECYLDTSRFRNAQLRLTHALTISATAGFATGTGALTVIAKLIEDGAPANRGFIMSKSFKSWTSLASGREDTELPLDYPYQSLMFKDLKTLIEPDVNITNLKLEVNSGRWTPFDLSTAIILADNMQRFPQFHQQLNFLNDTAVTWLSDLYARGEAHMGPIGGTAKGGVSTKIAEQVVAYMTTGDSSSLFINVDAYAPHSCLYIPFGDGKEIEDFLPVQGASKLELQASQGAAGGACSIVANQLRA
jgi:hypothetical protein